MIYHLVGAPSKWVTEEKRPWGRLGVGSGVGWGLGCWNGKMSMSSEPLLLGRPAFELGWGL